MEQISRLRHPEASMKVLRLVEVIAALFFVVLSVLLLFRGHRAAAALPPVNGGFYRMKIGVACPLTGDLAEYGAAVRNGVALAREKAPAGRAAVQFVFEDNQYDPAKAVSALSKLREADEIELLYSWGETTLHAIAPIAERAKLPVVAMSLDAAPALGRAYIIRSINHAEEFAALLLEYFRKRGFAKIGVIKTEDPFLNSMTEGLQKQLRPGESLEVAAALLPASSRAAMMCWGFIFFQVRSAAFTARPRRSSCRCRPLARMFLKAGLRLRKPWGIWRARSTPT
jgi:hypothetical protein